MSKQYNWYCKYHCVYQSTMVWPSNTSLYHGTTTVTFCKCCFCIYLGSFLCISGCVEEYFGSEWVCDSEWRVCSLCQWWKTVSWLYSTSTQIRGSSGKTDSHFKPGIRQPEQTFQPCFIIIIVWLLGRTAGGRKSTFAGWIYKQVKSSCSIRVQQKSSAVIVMIFDVSVVNVDHFS